MTQTSLTRRNVSGSAAAAIARFVKGPTATMVTVSGSFSRSICSISSCAGLREGVKSECLSLTAWSSAASSGVIVLGIGLKRDFQVSSGLRWGCWGLLIWIVCGYQGSVRCDGFHPDRRHHLAVLY
jgi:hypothetical protein